MSYIFSYPLVVSLVSSTGDRIDRPYLTNPLLRSPLGFGLLAGFRRDGKGDFAAAGGTDLVKACVAEVLGVQGDSEYTQGELPWRTEFGSLLYLLRLRNNDAVLEALARAYVAAALTRWEPRVRLKAVTVTRANAATVLDKGTIAVIRLLYDIVADGSQVLVPDVNQLLEV